MTTILKSFVDELVVPLTGLLGKAEFSNSYLVLREVCRTAHLWPKPARWRVPWFWATASFLR
jgi:hypothetical protein